jgi:hypothetical protein
MKMTAVWDIAPMMEAVRTSETSARLHGTHAQISLGKSSQGE